MNTLTILILISVCTTLMACYRLYIEKVSRRWTQVQGNIVEVDPQSILEKGGGVTFNTDSDHVLEYVAQNQTFRHTVGDDSSFAVTPFKVWRRTPPVGPIQVRVNPNNPQQYYDPRHSGSWKIFIGFAVASLLGATIV